MAIEAKPRVGAPLRVVGGQVAVTGLAAALGLIWGVDAAKAVFFGGAVAFLPNAVFAWAVERAGDGVHASTEAVALLVRWGVKLALTVVLLVLAIAVADVGGGAFFVGLGLALATPLLSGLVAGMSGDSAGSRAEGLGQDK